MSHVTDARLITCQSDPICKLSDSKEIYDEVKKRVSLITQCSMIGLNQTIGTSVSDRLGDSCGLHGSFPSKSWFIIALIEFFCQRERERRVKCNVTIVIALLLETKLILKSFIFD